MSEMSSDEASGEPSRSDDPSDDSMLEGELSGGAGVDELSPELMARVREATELLEELGADFRKLAQIDDETRLRLVRAAGPLARPDRYSRKALAKVLARQRVKQVRSADQAVLNQTGIRSLRKDPVFRTPLPKPAQALDAPVRDDGEPDDGGWAAAEAAREEGAVPLGFGEGEARAAGEEGEAPEAGEGRDGEGATDATGSGGGPRVITPRLCYVCKTHFQDIHFFYDQMCAPCAELNWQKRNATADLRGRVVMVTGARVKIGYQAAIKVLRAGAECVVATRFPVDAARRFAAEPDAAEWTERLHIYGIDLRHTPSVEALCEHLNATLPRLDGLINNACQTVRRPAGWYDHVVVGESAAWSEVPTLARPFLERNRALRAAQLPAAGPGASALLAEGAADPQVAVADKIKNVGLWRSAVLSQVPLLAEDLERNTALFPAGRLDADLQQVDQRTFNSWRMTLAEVPTAELLEVHLVNAVAPFVLNARLKPLLARAGSRDAHIVNVSAMEGQFYRRWKTDRHPHTNMAKAALNMMTRTSAADYLRDGIHMNSVDTGWVTDEDPLVLAKRKVAVHSFHPPLDIVDGAARIVDPLFDGVTTGRHVWGVFLKDYRPAPW
jgi:NAD(P)-dependent dehydrogenase (short-subunit alcohol dehydrogenase family)